MHGGDAGKLYNAMLWLVRETNPPRMAWDSPGVITPSQVLEKLLVPGKQWLGDQGLDGYGHYDYNFLYPET